MSKLAKTLALIIGTTLGQGVAAQNDTQPTTLDRNPIIWFEIPAVDMERAKDFYEAVFQVDLQDVNVGPSRLAVFPGTDGSPGAAGAIAKRSGFEPSRGGALVFFRVDSIEDAITRARNAGGEIIMTITELPGIGYTANVGDPEGNQIALYQLF